MRWHFMPCVTGHYGDLITGQMVHILIADWICICILLTDPKPKISNITLVPL